MTDEQGAEGRVPRKDRLAKLGLMAGMIGHELRNPLGVVVSSASLLLRKVEKGTPAARHAEKIERNAKACSRIIDDLLHLAREQPARRESLYVLAQVERARESADLSSNVIVEIEVPEGLQLDADPGLLERALVNVLRNADAAMHGEGRVRVRARDLDDSIEIEVTDGGPGFDDAVLRDDPFEPLNTGRVGGTGLGLALVRDVMQAHGGEAQALNSEDSGARIVLRFPKDTP